MEAIEAIEIISKRLKPKDLEKFKVILNLAADFRDIRKIVLKDIEVFSSTYAKCSFTISNNIPDKKTGLFDPPDILSCVGNFDKTGEQYELLIASMQESLRKWNARDSYFKEIAILIVEEGVTKKVVQGMEKLIAGYTKQIEEIKNYNVLFSEVLNKLHEIEKILKITVN